jgi:hypothetical protein
LTVWYSATSHTSNKALEKALTQRAFFMTDHNQIRPRYAQIPYDSLSLFDISPAEYMYLDMVYQLSRDGWCYKSLANIGKDLNMSKSAIVYMRNRLSEKELIVINKKGYVKTAEIFDRSKLEYSGSVQKMNDIPTKPIKKRSNIGTGRSNIEQMRSNIGTKNNNKDKQLDNTTNVVLAEQSPAPAKYGKQEINELFDYWEKVVGYKITSRKQLNRYAVNNLLKQMTTDEVKRIIEGVALALEDQYAPNKFSDFVGVQRNLNDLLAWGRKKRSTPSVGVIS